MIEFVAFLGTYLGIIASEWAAWLAAALGLLGLVEFLSGKQLVPRVTRQWKVWLCVGLVLVAQVSAYKRLFEATGGDRKMIERVSDFIEQARQIKARYRAKAPREYDAADPTEAVRWEAAVCEYLTKTRDRSYCIRFNSRLTPLVNPANQRRDALEAAIDARVERLEQMQLDLARPRS